MTIEKEKYLKDLCSGGEDKGGWDGGRLILQERERGDSQELQH